MIELKYEDYGLVAPMQEKIDAGFTYCKAVLEGNHTGKVFVDDEVCPTAALIWAPYQYSCLIGTFNDLSFVKSALAWLDEQASKRHGCHCLVLHPSNENDLPDTLLSEFTKLELITKIPSDSTKSVCRNICDENSNVEVVSFSDLNEEQSVKASELIGIGRLCWDKYEDLLDRGRGKVLLVDHCAVGICVSAWSSGGEDEVWINIDEEYRGRGLSPVLAASLVLESIEDGNTPIWQTTKENLSSVKLSEMLEMQVVNSPVVLFRDVSNV